jgi:pantoate--beta-alanine ligase
MKIILSVREMHDFSREAHSEGRSIGLVPTMGFLHEGHLSLIRRAKESADIVIVSLFVNPVQFGPGEDFSSYPRDFDRDRGLCEDAGVDVLFSPPVEELYPHGYSVYVEETQLSTGLCGASRPGHFRGVATVVAKLFNVVQPDVAVFGQKDAQQVRVIEQMVRDLNFSMRILVGPTVREPDGLAMSSRNAYLSGTERERATCLYKTLCLAQRLYDQGIRDSETVSRTMRESIDSTEGAKIDYIALVDYETLKPVRTVQPGTLIALAVRVGRTRLIDNTLIGPSET